MDVYMYLFAIDHKKVIIYIYKLVKSRIDKQNNNCDVKYITNYTGLQIFELDVLPR